MSFLRDPVSLIASFSSTPFPEVRSDQFYRPALMVSFIIDTLIGKGSPFAYHITNVLLHFGAFICFFYLLIELGVRRLFAFPAAFLFLVHPVHSQAVAWIPGRNDTLLGIALFLHFIALIRYARSPGVFRGALCIAFYLAALFTKETAIMSLFASFGLLTFFYRDRERAKCDIFLFSIMILVSGLYIYVRHLVVSPMGDVFFFRVIMISMRDIPAAFVVYLGKLFFPFNLSVLPIREDSSLIPGFIAAGLIVFLLAIAHREDKERALWGISWFALFLLPTLFNDERYLFEHRAYVPSAGIIIAMISLLQSKITANAINTKAFLAFISGVVILFPIKAYYSLDRFQNPFIFALSAVKTSPHADLAHTMLAWQYLKKGFPDAAFREANIALSIKKYGTEPNRVQGYVFVEKKQYSKARYHFGLALAANPDCDSAYFGLAVIGKEQGRIGEARYYIDKALALKPHQKEYRDFLKGLDQIEHRSIVDHAKHYQRELREDQC